nr:hypothetical protein [Streptomyces thermolilacinus]
MANTLDSEAGKRPSSCRPSCDRPPAAPRLVRGEGAGRAAVRGEKGKPFRRSTSGRKWRRGPPQDFRLYDLRHTRHTLAPRSGATFKDTTVRAAQSTEKAALIYQHSDHERQREVAAGLDRLVQSEREKASGTQRARET